MNNDFPSDVQLVEEIRAKKEQQNDLAASLADLNIRYHQVA